MFRMWFVVFFGHDRTVHEVAHEEEAGAHAAAHGDGHGAHAWTMQVAVAVLMVPAVIAGYLGIGGESSPWARFLAPTLTCRCRRGPRRSRRSARRPPRRWCCSAWLWGSGSPTRAAGSAAAIEGDAVRLEREARATPLVLRRGYFVDDLIQLLIVRPAQLTGAVIARIIDPRIVDGLVRDLAWLAGVLGLEVRTLQNGQVRGYAFTITLGGVAFLAYFAHVGGAR